MQGRLRTDCRIILYTGVRQGGHYTEIRAPLCLASIPGLDNVKHKGKLTTAGKMRFGKTIERLNLVKKKLLNHSSCPAMPGISQCHSRIEFLLVLTDPFF